MRLPQVMRHRDFNLYFAGVVFSEIGIRATVAANLFHVFQLTGSTLQVGFVGLFQAIALLVLSPLGGAYADRLDRRRLVQISQGLSMVVTLTLAVGTLLGAVTTWHILVSVLLNTAAATFDRPARQALIPAIVPRDQLVQAYALVNPGREVAILVGPTIAGLLIALSGPAAVYLFDAASYVVLIAVLALLKVPPIQGEVGRASLWASITEGVRFVRHRPIIWQFMSLDLSATLFGAYRVVLPAFATVVLGAGPLAYGLLSSAPSAGALLGSALVFRLIKTRPSGHIVLAATIGYGLAAVVLAQSRVLGLALLAAGGLGLFDALATTIRHAAVQLETPDDIRGRVTSIYQMASRGGPALGDLNIGSLAGAVGPVAALTIGGLVPVAYAAALAVRGGRVRDYQVAEAAV